MISLFQIYFDAKSESFLEKECIPFFKDWQDDYFENSVIRYVYEKIKYFNHTDISVSNDKKQYSVTDNQYLGITSWKQGSPIDNKSHLSSKEVIDYIQKDIEAGTNKDVYIYSPVQGFERIQDGNPELHGIIKFHTIWEGHKGRQMGQVHIDNKLLNDSLVLPFDIFDGRWQFCHCNYWIAKKEIFDQYCNDVLLPALHFFNKPEIKQQMPKWYSHRHNGEKFTSSCFTMEGLFGSFLAHTQYSFDYICKKRIQGKYKMVKIDKYEPIPIPDYANPIL